MPTLVLPPSSTTEGCYVASVVGNVAVDEHIKYIIEVTSPDGDSWIVRRRYREVKLLHKDMCMKYADAPLQLPKGRLGGLGKWLLGKLDSISVAERQVSLQRYISSLLSLDPQVTTPALQIFLGCPEASAIKAKDGTREQLKASLDPKLDKLRRALSGVIGRPVDLKHHCQDAGLSILELPEISSAVVGAAGATAARRFRAASRSAGAGVNLVLPALADTSCICVCGVGASWEDTKLIVERFSPQSGQWEKFPHTILPRGLCAAASLEGCLYLMGGVPLHNEDHLRPECWELATGRRWLLPPMKAAYTHFASAAAGGFVYVFGGLSEGHAIARAYRFSIMEEAWAALASMPTPRFECAAAAAMGQFYVLGGAGVNCQALAAVESYNPGTDKWQRHPSLRSPRFGSSVVVTRGRIYVLGGQVLGGFACSLADVFDPRTEEWLALPHMPEGRRRCGAAAAAGKIYVFGGGRLSVDCFHPREGRWEELDPMPSLCSSCVAVAVLS